MSALNAAIRHAEHEDNKDRPFILHVSMQYGRVISGAVGLATAEQIREDGGVAIHVWENGQHTDKLVFVTGARVLWCEIEWLD